MITSNKGFTLVEALVSGIIGAIIAGLILTIFTLQGSALNEGTANAKMLRQANAVTDRLARSVRRANLVLAQDEHEKWEKNFDTTLAVRSVSTVLLYDTNGTRVSGYRIHGGKLDTTSNGTGWKALCAGTDTIKVESGSDFALPANRKGLSANITLKTVYRSKTYSMPITGGRFSCRN